MRANPGEARLRHAGARQDAAALDPGGCGHHDHRINAPPAALFKEQGNVEHDHRPRSVAPEEAAACALHRRVDDTLEPAQLIAIGKHQPAQRSAIDTRRARGPRKGGLDRGEQRAAGALETVNLGIGIEDRHAQCLEHRRHRRLAHADRAGEADDDHATSRARNSSSCARGAATPKKSSKATAACPTSISSPSIVSRPRASAAASSTVSSGA